MRVDGAAGGFGLHVDGGLGRYTYWNFAVKTGSTMHLVKFHPVR
jgi:hypothetical protein